MKQSDLSRDGYITLKEAAKITGYSADYIGQLIRKGKISGRQIYTNIAWVTTEDAIRDYLEKEGRKKNDNTETDTEYYSTNSNDETAVPLDGVSVAEKMIRWLLYLAFFLAIISVLALFYMLSVSIDHKLSHDQFQTFSNAAPLTAHQNGYAKR
jgi:hypothetical protein